MTFQIIKMGVGIIGAIALTIYLVKVLRTPVVDNRLAVLTIGRSANNEVGSLKTGGRLSKSIKTISNRIETETNNVDFDDDTEMLDNDTEMLEDDTEILNDDTDIIKK